MGRVVRTLSLLPLACGLAGCLPEAWYGGTLQGFSICKKAAEQASLSATAAKAVCTEKHQRAINRPDTEGKAGYEVWGGLTHFVGQLKNNSTDVVITEFSITINNEDATFFSQSFDEQTIKSQWIEPRDFGYFRIPNSQLKYKEGKNTDKMKWYTHGFKGLRVNY